MSVKKNKLVIVGVGNVGSAVLNCALSLNLAPEIAVVDIREPKAHGEALDSSHAAPYALFPNIRIRAGAYDECRDASVIIIAAGPSILPGEPGDRLSLAGKNVAVMKNVMTSITRYTKEAVIIMITNPLDIMVYYAQNFFDYPRHKLFGTGTTLETARFKRIIADHYQIDPKDVHGYILGEHGNSAFAAWSLLNIAGLPAGKLDEFFAPAKPLDREKAAAEVINVAYDVLKSKGWTNSGIAMAACRIARAVLFNEQSVFPVSTTLEGEYGLHNVALSLPCVVGAEGISRRLAVPLTEDELSKLKNSAASLAKVIDSVGLNQ